MIVLMLLMGILIFLFLKKIKLNSISKKIIKLYIFWTFSILIISMFNWFDLYSVSAKAYAFWLVNIVIIITFIIVFSKKISESFDMGDIINRITKSKKFLVIGIIITIGLLFFKLRYNNVIKNLPLEQIRMARFDSLFNSGIESFIFEYILTGGLYIYLIITSILIVNKKFKSKICIVSIINLILHTSIGFGRMTIFFFILYLVIAYFTFNSEKKIKINLKSIIIGIALLILALIVGAIIIVIRLKGFENLSFENIFNYGIPEQLKQIYTYFTGGFRLLDNYLYNGFQGINEYTFSRATFGGVEDIFGLLTSAFKFNFETINSIIAPITQTSVQVGINSSMNAFYTCIMNYYCDMGYIGIVVFPIMHSALIVYSINNFLKNKSLIAYILMIFVISNLLCSIYRWNYQLGNVTFVLIVLIIANKIFNKKITIK